MKKNTIKKSVIATVLATSLLTSTNVGYANTTLQELVDQARKDMKEAAYAYVVPSQNGKIPKSEELYQALNTAKENYQKAKNAVVKSKDKNKDALLKDLNDLYNERITKGIIPYIDAYNYVDKYLNPIMDEIKKAESEKDWAKVEKLYHKLSVQLKSRTVILYRFSGKAARDLLLEQYKEPANLKRDQLMVPVTIYMKVQEAEKLLADGKQAEAKKILESIRALQHRLPSTSNLPIVKELLEKVEEVAKKAGEEIKPTPPTGNNGGSNNGGGNNGGGNNGSNFELSLMHTNDTHAKVETATKRITAIKEFRKQKPNALLIDAGDVFSGTLYFNEYKGQADLEFMNLAGYDLMTFGNHEFDLGSTPEGHQALAEFIKGAEFSFVSTNADFSADDKFKGLFSDLISSKPEDGKIYNGIVKEIKGQKVGFFGLTTAETKGLSSPGKVTFTDYIEEAEKAVKAFEKMGVNKIVAVTHIGYDDNPEVDNDLSLAAHVDGIDVIIGGHSHTKLDAPVIIDKDEKGVAKDKTIIVQASSQGDFLGTLNVEFDNKGKIIGQNGKLIEVGKLAEDPEAKTILGKYKPQVDKVAKTEIGVSTDKVLVNPRTNGDNTKPSVRKNETVLGNLIADGMLVKAKSINSEVIMAFQNGGGIRSEIGAGPITVGEVITVLPFGNTLSTMKITGAELKEAFETSFGVYPLENGGFLHVAGAKVEFDSSKPKGERVVSISYEKVKGEYVEIQDSETYTVATNYFTAQGGDNYTVFKKLYDAGKVNDLGLSDWENFRDHLKSLDNIPTETEGRIVDVAGQVNEPIDADDFSGTVETPKVYKGDVTVSVTDAEKLENAVVNGDLIITGTPNATLFISNVKVTGNVDLSGIEGKTFDLDGLTVDGEIIL